MKQPKHFYRRVKYNWTRKYFFALLSGVVFISLSKSGISQHIDSMMNVYADQSAPERIHVHFDRTIYNKGETIWYKVYILQGVDTGLTSKNVYMEWYGVNGKLISRSVAPIVFSAASGSFDVPTDLEGDKVEVSVFTRWKLNDDSAFQFRRQLRINNTAVTRKDTRPGEKTNVTVFPEGGSLIQGLRSRVAFKATNPYGDPVGIKGVLTDEANNNLDSIHVLHDGMGSFFLTPLNATGYRLEWTDENGITGTTPMPVSKSNGAQLTVTRNKKKALFRIERSKDVPDNFERMTLLIHMNRIGLYQVAINATQKTAIQSEISIDDLPTGLLQFTLFTSDWVPVAERVMFINNEEYTFDVTVTAPKISLEVRGKNVIDLHVRDTLFSNMSLAITDDELSGTDEHTIFSDFFLAGEIKGKVYNPGYYLSGNTEEIAGHLDLVMLTNGWRRFDWEKIKAQIGPRIEHSVESEYMKLIGKVTGIKIDGKTRELNMIIVGKDSSRQFLSATLQHNGSFEYPSIFFDTATIIYGINNDPLLNKKIKLSIENGLLVLRAKTIVPLQGGLFKWDALKAKQKMDALLSAQELLRQQKANATLQEVVVTAKAKTREEELDDKYTTGFFRTSPARKSYVLDMTDPSATTVTSARNVIEYLVNKIPGLVVNRGSLQWRGHGPVLYMDEMQVDLATIRDIPLLNVAMIKAFPPLFMFATGGGAGGAVAIYTRRGNDYTPPKQQESGLQSVQVAGYTQFREFYNPDYEKVDSGYTSSDSRTTLYWNPHLMTSQAQQGLQIEFFNNDFTRSFKLVLEGLNAAGKMVRVEKRIVASSK